MRGGRFCRADGGLPSPSVFWGGKNRAAQGPLRWNLPKLPPLPGETGVDWKNNGIFNKMRGTNIRHETDLKRMEIGENEFKKKKTTPY